MQSILKIEKGGKICISCCIIINLRKRLLIYFIFQAVIAVFQNWTIANTSTHQEKHGQRLCHLINLAWTMLLLFTIKECTH